MGQVQTKWFKFSRAQPGAATIPADDSRMNRGCRIAILESVLHVSHLQTPTFTLDSLTDNSTPATLQVNPMPAGAARPSKTISVVASGTTSKVCGVHLAV